MFKICVIGCGGIANSYHGPALVKYCAENEGAVLAACCNRSVHKAEAYAQSFGFKAFYGDYREMLKAERPDAVCVYASYVSIPDIAVDVMDMGFPVMMEKPPGVNREDVSRIIDAAGRNNVPNQVAFNRRYAPIVGVLKKALDGLADTGGIDNVRCVFQRVGRKDSDFYTTAIHGIDTVRYIAGSDYSSISFRYQELPDVNDGAANIYMDCLMKSGAAAQLCFLPCGGKVIEDYYVTCRGNDFELKMPVWGAPDYPGGLYHYSGNELAERIDGGGPQFGAELYEKFGIFSENASFFNSVKANAPISNDIRSALQSVEVADCIQQRMNEYSCE